jgi:hypothetical protein
MLETYPRLDQRAHDGCRQDISILDIEATRATYIAKWREIHVFAT